jgi:DNA mismatch repair ATPase MutS
MDEIFNSTNYEEGVAGAYIVAKELGKIPNSLAIVTTHFPYLTKLSKTGNFLNYKFEVQKEGSTLKPTYYIKEGISKQHLALDMLEKKGYNPSVIEEARKIFKELVKITHHDDKEKKVDSVDTLKVKNKKILKSESLKLEIQPQLEGELNLKKETELLLDVKQKQDKNLDLVCVIQSENSKEKILEKIQKAVEEKVSKDLSSDS